MSKLLRAKPEYFEKLHDEIEAAYERVGSYGEAQLQELKYLAGNFARLLDAPRTSEEELNQIFGDNRLWKGRYKISWCELCECISIWCPDCQGSNCNAGGCEKCHDDTTEFNTLKFDPQDWMDCEDIQRQRFLKKYGLECAHAGRQGMDWQWLLWEGKMCQAAEEMFADQIKGLDRNPKWDKV